MLGTGSISSAAMSGRSGASPAVPNVAFAGLVRKMLVSGGRVGFTGVARKLLASSTSPVLFSGLRRQMLVSSPPVFITIPIFPNIPQGYPIKVSPVLDTTIGTTKSLREMRFAQRSVPLWDIEVPFYELRDQTQNQTPYAPLRNFTEFTQLCQLFLMMYGQTGNFAFDCPWDNSRTDQLIGTGDGLTFVFTIYRTWGLGAQATQASIGMINTVINVKVNGSTVSATHYTVVRNKLFFVDSAGNTYPPPAAATVTMTFSFYYVCRFVEDEQNFEEFAKDRWTVPSLKFRAINWP